MRKVEGRESRVEGQMPMVALRPNFGPRPSTLDSRPSRRSGVTLIELLIVILIISILAGLILGVAAVAGETAREDHTRNIVSRMHTLLMEHYGTYKSRRVVLNQLVTNTIDNPSTPASVRGLSLAEARLYALREMMLMDIPDRWSDVLLGPVPDPPLGQNDAQLPIYLPGRTDLSNVYLRRYLGLVGRTNSVTGEVNTSEDITDNQGAECLYMIITLATADGEARSLFGESTIGDVDGDGAPEFLDGWGNPINFLRWAPGFDSQIQLNANRLGAGPPTTHQSTSNWLSQANADHDPYDVFHVEPAAFRLVPLIFSPGSDEEPGVRLVKPWVTWRPPQTNRPSGNMVGGFPRLTPYWPVLDPDEGNVFLGTTYEGATDNIHNHLLGLR